MEYTNRSIFMCTYIFEIDLSTSKTTSKANKRVEGVIVKGKDLEALKNNEWSYQRALSIGGLKGKKVRLKEIIIEKYLSESFVD